MREHASPKSWRRRLRFSVRALMVLVLGLGGWFGWVVHCAHVQRDAVLEIQNAGGLVSYEWEFKDGVRNGNLKLWWPKWLVDRIGVDCFGSVTVVDNWKSVSDAEMAYIGRLNRLEVLNLANRTLTDQAVTDTGLTHLKGLTNLRELWLVDTKVTDAGLVNLEGLMRLERLFLDYSEFSDAGVAHLKGLTNLQELYLDNTKVGDTGLVHLKKMTGLRVLGLFHTNVTDAGLINLKGLKNLQKLYLGDTQITDAGLAELKGLTGLRDLSLYNTKNVTDAGLAHLRGLTNLRSLDLRNEVTDVGVRELQHSLPKVQVSHCYACELRQLGRASAPDEP